MTHKLINKIALLPLSFMAVLVFRSIILTVLTYEVFSKYVYIYIRHYDRFEIYKDLQATTLLLHRQFRTHLLSNFHWDNRRHATY